MFPSGFDMSTLVEDTSATLRLISQSPGPGTVSTTPDGLLIEENVTTELLINRPENSQNGKFRYTQFDTRFYIPAAHSLPNISADAEYCIYFKNAFNQKIACLVLLCKKGALTDSTAPYFMTLSAAANPNRPVLSTLFSPTDSFVEYVGADLRGRTRSAPIPKDKCDPVKQYVTYYICTTPISLGPAFQALQTLLSPTNNTGPPQQLTPSSNLMKYVSLVKGIQVGDPTANPGSTSALKCYRIDPVKDVVDGKIKIKSSPTSTLAQELAALDGSTATPSSDTILPGDVGEYIGIAIGVLVAFLGVAGGYLYWYNLRANEERAATALQAAAQDHLGLSEEERAATALQAAAQERLGLSEEERAATALQAAAQERLGIPTTATAATTETAVATPEPTPIHGIIGGIVGFALAVVLMLFVYAGNSGNVQVILLAVFVGIVLLCGGAYWVYTTFLAT